jgi:hypothetical protein
LGGTARIIVRAVTLGARGSLGQTYEVVIRMLDLVTAVASCTALGECIFVNTLIEELRL